MKKLQLRLKTKKVANNLLMFVMTLFLITQSYCDDKNILIFFFF